MEQWQPKERGLQLSVSKLFRVFRVCQSVPKQKIMTINLKSSEKQ